MPDFVTTDVVAPLVSPYSAGAFSVRMRNSLTASTGMRKANPPFTLSTFDDAIQQIIIRFRPLAIDRVGLARARDAARFGQAGSHGSHSGLKQAELRQVATVQWQIDGLGRGNDISDRLTRVDKNLLPGYLDFRVRPGKLQRNGQVDDLTDIDPNKRQGQFRKAVCLYGNRVLTNREVRKMERSIVRGTNRSRHAFQEFRAVILAPGTRPTEGSDICPSRVPMGSCALAETMRKPRTRKNANCFLKRDHRSRIPDRWYQPNGKRDNNGN